jgi:hypothetical protein
MSSTCPDTGSDQPPTVMRVSKFHQYFESASRCCVQYKFNLCWSTFITNTGLCAANLLRPVFTWQLTGHCGALTCYLQLLNAYRRCFMHAPAIKAR